MRYLLFFYFLFFSIMSTAVLAADNNTSNNNDVIGFIMTVDNNEISAAKTVLKKKDVSPSVKQYAREMVKDHSANLKTTKALCKKMHAKSKNSAEVMMLAMKGKKELVELKILSGKKLEKNYIDAMVEDHSQVLDKLDTFLKDDNLSAALKTHVEATRASVATHLQHAKDIQAQLK